MAPDGHGGATTGTMPPAVLRILAVLVASTSVAACGGGSDDDGRTLIVFAASSLTGVAESLTEAFMTSSEDIDDVEIDTGGSDSLARLINDGTPADVLLTADLDTMASLDQPVEPVVIAHNRATVVVPADNPAGIETTADLAGSVTLAVCEPVVPCGDAALELFQRAGIDPSPATLEPNVRSVLTKVELGEVDAGVVYRTDADRSSSVLSIPVEDAPRRPVAAAAVSERDAAAGVRGVPRLERGRRHLCRARIRGAVSGPSRPGPHRTRPPLVVLIPAVLAVAFLTLPLIAVLQRLPWGDAWDILRSDRTTDALRVTLTVVPITTLVSVLLGVPLGWVLARAPIRGRTLLRAIVLLPMVLPPVVGGTALLFALGRRGLVGQWLDEWFGITLPFTTAGAIVATTFVALPFVVITIEGGLRAVDPRTEEMAATLGASPATTLRTVTLPAISGSLRAAVALAAARALGEFGATIAFAGNRPGATRTLPLEVFRALEEDPATALVISVLLIAVSLLVLIALRGRWWPE